MIGTLYLLLAVFSVQLDDITYDEQDHLNYGIRILKGKSSRQQEGADFNTTMPVSLLNALPRAVEQLFSPSLKKNDFGKEDVQRGRYITILTTLLFLCYMYFFGKTIGNAITGCWAMLIAASDPNILAHSRLVTTDLYSTLAFVAVIYHLFQWLIKKKSIHFIYWSIAIAIAQCCKINNILLYPISLVSVIASYFLSNQPIKIKKTIIQAVTFSLLQLLIINSAFLFDHTGLSLNEFTFESSFFRNLQNGWASSVPIPFPKSFIDTYDLTQFERESFRGTAQNYLLGELRSQKGFWNYYFVCWFVKTPLLTQLLILVSAGTMLAKKQYRQTFILLFLVPILFMLFLLSSSTVQSGYRYLLPVLSLLMVPAALLIQTSLQHFPRFASFAACLLIAVPALTCSFNYISYTSEWQVPKKNAYRYLSDSNLNWGQRHEKIQQFLEENPQYQFEPPAPVTGYIIVDINNLTGIINENKFNWLRDNFTPVKSVEGCYLLYEVKKLPTGY